MGSVWGSIKNTVSGAYDSAVNAVEGTGRSIDRAFGGRPSTGDIAAQQKAEADAAQAAAYAAMTPEERAAEAQRQMYARGPSDIEQWNTAMPTSYYLGGDPNAANAYAAQAQATGQQAATKLNQAANMSAGVGYEMGSQLAAAGTGYGEAVAGTGVQAGYNLSQTGQQYGQELAGLGAQSGYNLSKYGTRAAAGINATGQGAQDYSQQAASGIEGASSIAQLYGIKQGQALDQQGAAAQQYGQQQAGSLAKSGQFGQAFGLNQAQSLAGQGTAAQQYGIGQAGQVERSAAQLSQMGQGVYDQSGAAANRDIVGQQRAAIQGIESSEGPSAAQAQLQAGLNKSQAQSLAMARSGRGWGGSAGAMSQAQQQNAAMSQGAANQAAVLRAQEEAAYRTRAATNLNAAASMGLNQANLNDAQQRALIEAGMAGVQSGGQMRAQAASLGQNAYSQQIAAQQAAAGVGQAGIAQTLAAQEAAAGIGQQGYAQQLAAKQAGIQAGQAGIGQNIAGLQAAAGVGQQGYAQQIAAQQAAGSLGVGAMQAGSQLAMSGLEAGGNMSMAGQEAGGRLATDSLAAGGGLALAGIEGGGNMQLAGIGQSGQLASQAGIIGLAGQDAALAAQQQQVANNSAYIDQMLQNQATRAGIQMNAANNQAAASESAKDRTMGYITGITGAIGQGLSGLSDRNAKKDIRPTNAEILVPPLSDTSGMGGPGGYDWGTGVSGPHQAQGDASDDAALAASAEQAGNSSPGMTAMLSRFGGGLKGLSQGIARAGGGAFQPNRAPPIDLLQPTALPMTNRRDYMSLSTLPALSDEREKESLAAIEETPGYSYNYKDPDAMGAEPGRQYGIMAQDLEKTEAGRSVVKRQPDGTRMVDTSRLALLEAGAMNALTKKVAELEAKVAATKKSKSKAA